MRAASLFFFGLMQVQPIAMPAKLFGACQSRDTSGSLVERIDTRGNRFVDDETIRLHIHARPAEFYSKAQLRSDIQELYRTHLFEYIQVDEKENDAGKVVTFIIKERPVIASVEYQGINSFTESDISKAYAKGKGPYPIVNTLYDPRMVRTAEQMLKALMTQHGKPAANVYTEIRKFPPGSVLIRFVVDENAAARQ